MSSSGVVWGISRKITIQRLWFGRTFNPSSSTCTFGDSDKEILLLIMKLKL